MRILALLTMSLVVSSGLDAMDAKFRVDVLDGTAVAGPESNGSVPWEIGVRVGERSVPATVGVVLESSLPSEPEGAQGWSLSFEIEDCFQILGATTEGTAGADAPEGRRNGGFEKTEIVNPGDNNGRYGVVSGVVLDFNGNTYLDPVGEYLVLLVTGRVDASSVAQVGQETAPCELAPLTSPPYLRGSGVPIESVVTVDGASVDLEATNADIIVKGVSSLFDGEYRVDVLSPIGDPGVPNGSTIPWEIGVSVGRGLVPVELGVQIVSEMEDQEKGVEAWSISLETDPCFELLGATTDGTVAAPAPEGLRSSGFESTEIIDPASPGNDGRQGVVSASILSFGGGITLDPVSEALVLRVTGNMDASSISLVGDATPPCGIRPLSSAPWLRGSGQPVETVVTVDSNSIAPPSVRTSGAAVTLIGDAPAFEGEYRVDLLDALATAGSRTDDTVPWTLPVPFTAGSASASVSTGVYLVSEISTSDVGAEAWSVAVETEPCFRVTAATTDGTVGADAANDPEGRRIGGFERTEIVDPARNDGRTGVVSAVILSLTERITLDPISEELVLRIAGDMDVSEADEQPSCTVRPVSGGGLKGAGQPVESLVTITSNAFLASGVGAEITLDPSVPQFRRGDANNDGTANIADATEILGFLFAAGDELTCRDAADADDTGTINIADAVYLFTYLFSTGRNPPAPGPFECGPDEDDSDDLDCVEYSC